MKVLQYLKVKWNETLRKSRKEECPFIIKNVLIRLKYLNSKKWNWNGKKRIIENKRTSMVIITRKGKEMQLIIRKAYSRIWRSNE